MSSLERDIQAARAHLGDTVDALTAKAETGKRRLGVAALVGGAALVALLLWRRLG